MKSHNQYSFDITYSGMAFRCDVDGTSISVQSRGFFEERAWESLKRYLEAEGFIKELDERKGILDLFKS
jgi:hypothetical protein